MLSNEHLNYKNTCAIIQAGADSKYYLQLFDKPDQILHTHETADVPDIVEAAAEAARQQKFAVGFVTYDAAPAFDPACVAHRDGTLPLAWFAIYGSSKVIEIPPYRKNVYVSPPAATLSRDTYLSNIEAIKEHIAAGETYQVNYTYQLTGKAAGDMLDLFIGLFLQQPTPYAAFIGTETHVICSASPELFFSKKGAELICCPMKGTMPAGDNQALHTSQKDRAENIMIVDMIRNDLGRICVPGSIETRELFNVHHYATVNQMTSTVQGNTSANAKEIFKALFPCASVTGAPKIKTCRIIQELEQAPRGLYTGAVGHFAPDDSARFNVAIRTLTVERATGSYTYGIGSGITWDSDPEQEFQECVDKSRILPAANPDFHIFSTMLKTAGGIPLIERHLERLAASARVFGIPFTVESALKTLQKAPEQLHSSGAYKIRLLVYQDGSLQAEYKPLSADNRVWHAAIGCTPVSSQSLYLDHKTSNRDIYEKQLAEHPEADDVLLWNQHNELTESCFANIIVYLDGRWVTPDPATSFLKGTRRAEYIETGRVQPARVTKDDLLRARRIYLINAVRPLMPVKLHAS